MSVSHRLVPSDYYGPIIGALIFVLIMSPVKEPARRNFNAVLVAGTCGAYLSGGFGIWELAYPLMVTPVVYAGLRSYRFIGIAWLTHAAWDLAHHLRGNPLWPFMPTSSWGCMLFDATIAIWFLASAPARLAINSAERVMGEARPERSTPRRGAFSVTSRPERPRSLNESRRLHMIRVRHAWRFPLARKILNRFVDSGIYQG